MRKLRVYLDCPEHRIGEQGWSDILITDPDDDDAHMALVTVVTKALVEAEVAEARTLQIGDSDLVESPWNGEDIVVDSEGTDNLPLGIYDVRLTEMTLKGVRTAIEAIFPKAVLDWA